MEKNFGAGQSAFTYFRANPTERLDCPRDWQRWGHFLRDFVLRMCGSDPVALIYHDAFGDGPIPIQGAQESTAESLTGATFRIFELPEITAGIFADCIFGANELRQNGDLFIWKPMARIQQLKIQRIIRWRDAMFDLPIPFSEILPTEECIGFPAEDGEGFNWANPNVPLASLESIALSHNVEIFEVH